MLFEIGVLKNFPIFTRKHIYFEWKLMLKTYGNYFWKLLLEILFEIRIRSSSKWAVFVLPWNKVGVTKAVLFRYDKRLWQEPFWFRRHNFLYFDDKNLWHLWNKLSVSSTSILTTFPCSEEFSKTLLSSQSLQMKIHAPWRNKTVKLFIKMVDHMGKFLFYTSTWNNCLAWTDQQLKEMKITVYRKPIF